MNLNFFLKKKEALKKNILILLCLSTAFVAPASLAKEVNLFRISEDSEYDASIESSKQVKIKTSGEIKFLREDDSVQLSFDGDQYQIIVKNRTVHANGDVSIQGLIDGKHNAFITRGSTGSFANIDTPDGKYIIGQSSQGEYLLSPNEFNKLIARPFGSDARIPPTKHGSEAPAVKAPIQQNEETGTATIDVMVLFTPEVISQLGSVSAVETRINQLISINNQAYIDSKMKMVLNLVHTEQIAASNTDNNILDDITDGTGIFSGVSALRENKGADLVVLFRAFDAAHTFCGQAWLLGEKSTGTMPQYERDYGYSVVHNGSLPSGYYCTDNTFAHEIGHNSGFAHDQEHAGGPGLFSYSYGHDDPGTFATIMSYDSPEVSKFSNPSVNCNGSPCGIANSADNARSGNNIRHGLAAFYESVTLPTINIMATDDLASEDSTDEGSGTFAISRTGDTSDDLQIAINIAGTADYGSDYTINDPGNLTPHPVPPPHTIYYITMPSGGNSINFIVLPNDDELQEDTESVELSIQPSSTYQLGAAHSSASINILDNDSDVIGNESDATLSIGSVTGTPGSLITVPVTFSNSNLPNSETGVVTIEFEINYPDMLLLSSFTASELGASVEDIDSGAGVISAKLLKADEGYNLLPLNSGNINLSFTISDQAPEGTYDIRFNTASIIAGGIDGALSLSEVSDGSVTVILVTPGDANGDGQINVLDVIGFINIVFNDAPNTDGGDCNSDGSTNVLDVICIINKVFN